jgi:hypothetical protein
MLKHLTPALAAMVLATPETGQVLVVPVSDHFSLVATNHLGETCMSTPAIADGTLLFRTRRQIIAVGRM